MHALEVISPNLTHAQVYEVMDLDCMMKNVMITI